MHGGLTDVVAGAARGEAAIKSIMDAHPGASIELLAPLDVSDDASVAAAAGSLAGSPPLYALVNNAGIMDSDTR